MVKAVMESCEVEIGVLCCHTEERTPTKIWWLSCCTSSRHVLPLTCSHLAVFYVHSLQPSGLTGKLQSWQGLDWLAKTLRQECSELIHTPAQATANWGQPVSDSLRPLPTTTLIPQSKQAQQNPVSSFMLTTCDSSKQSWKYESRRTTCVCIT